MALVEADVRLWRGRLEVRHLKTVGPVPILWDKWRSRTLRAAAAFAGPAPGGASRDALPARPEGPEPAARRAVLQGAPGRPARDGVRAEPAGCSSLLPTWTGVRLFQSVGSRRQLRRLLRTEDGLAPGRRLDPRATARRARGRSPGGVGPIVMSWPVNSLERATGARAARYPRADQRRPAASARLVVNTALATLDSLSDQIAALDARWILVALAFQLGNLSCRAIAWRGILVPAYPSARVRLARRGAAYAAGVAANAYLPGARGEAVKIALVRLRIPGSTVAGVGASNGVVLLFDAVVGASLLAQPGRWGSCRRSRGLPR